MASLKSGNSEILIKDEMIEKYDIKFQRSPSRVKSELLKTIKSAFMNRIITLSFENTNKECLLLEVFLKQTLGSLQMEVSSFLKANVSLKFNAELHAVYTKPFMKLFDNTSLQLKIFKTEMQEIFDIEELSEKFLILVKALKRRTADFLAREGGWTLLQLIKVDFNLNKYQPLKGATYIPTPIGIRGKGAVINVQNKDEFCFKWAVISALSDESKYLYRTSFYKVNIISETIQIKGFNLNFRELHFPLQVKDVSIFEKNNPNFSIHVFGYDDESSLVIGPYYKAKEIKTNHINLLYLESKINEQTVGHYVWIKYISRLLSKQISDNNGKITICYKCLEHYRTEEKHNKHCNEKARDVKAVEKCALEFAKAIRVDVPFVIYALSKNYSQNKTGNPLSYIFIYFIKCNYADDLNKWRIFKGSNSPRLFVENLIKDVKYYYDNYTRKTKPKLPLTNDEKFEYSKTYSCCLCLKAFQEGTKVKLHCRLTGKYKGPAHHTCAFNYRIPRKFPVIFHNLPINDCHLLIKEFSNIDDDSINVRTLNNDSHICFDKALKIDGGYIQLRILNFLKFLPDGLDNLVKKCSNTDFITLNSTYVDENKVNMVLKKHIFPHKYLNSFEQLNENCLPSIEHFNDPISDEKCSAEDYAHTLDLWTEFECKTVEDYLQLCLKTDVLLLTDVFENFRLICKNAYNLDPCHYFSAADFSWSAALKITDTKLNLPTDTDMISFLEKGMRPGISKCIQGHSVANNKYLYDYEDELPSKYLMCFHANNLYERVMTEHLPEGNFEWEIGSNFSLSSIPHDSEIGYILDVDLEYPPNIFESHRILPFCSENMNFLQTKEYISNDKRNYIIYYKNLQQCIKHGLRLKKINRILKFKQSDWLKKYIIYNKTFRSNNENAFEVNVFKSMNDVLFEKIMQKPDRKMKIFRKWETKNNRLGARAYIAKSDFCSVSLLDEDFVGVEFFTNSYNHVPVYLEFIISELVKLNMYSFHYEYITPKYKTNVELNYVDTDSLIYTITTDDLYRDIKNDICSMINTTACNKSRLLLKTLGIMKDANGGVVLKEFIGFGSKMYSLKSEAGHEIDEACLLKNDIFNYVCVSNSLLFDWYSILLKNEIYENNNTFKLKLHQRYAYLVDKKLPLGYLDEGDDILCNDINAQLVWFYY